MAEAYAREHWRQLHRRSPPKPGEPIVLAWAAELYAASKGLDLRENKHLEAKRINRLIKVIGKTLVTKITNATLVWAAREAYPNCPGIIMNREFMGIAAAVLRYASDNGYCNHLEVRMFKVPKLISGCDEASGTQLPN
jgi:hypothetical protein